jgi:hypothetical protein
MANIISSKNYLNDLEISADAPVTTQLNTRIGGAINYLNDKTDSLQADIDAIESNDNFVNRTLVDITFTKDSAAVNFTTSGNIIAISLDMFVGTNHYTYLAGANLQRNYLPSQMMAFYYANNAGPYTGGGGFWDNGLKYSNNNGAAPEVWAYVQMNSANNLNITFGGEWVGSANLKGHILHSA